MDTVEVQENVALAPLTTMGVGGPARFFARVRSESDLERALAFQQKHHLPLFALGGGSNLLVRDEGFPGMVIQLAIEGDTAKRPEGRRLYYDTPAGLDWDTFVRMTCEDDASGVECLAGIPGLTGGTPVQNVGAYGQEVAQSIRSIRAFDLGSRTFLEIEGADCQFSYRSSRFNQQDRGRFLVTRVVFGLVTGERPSLAYPELAREFSGQSPTPMAVYETVRRIRRAKGMLLTAGDTNSQSAGSFFKNPFVSAVQLASIARTTSLPVDRIPHWPAGTSAPAEASVKLSAAWLVEHAGFPKGFIDGRVGISTQHSLALINRGGASFADVTRLRDRIRAGVKEQFGVDLEQEPVELGSASPTQS